MYDFRDVEDAVPYTPFRRYAAQCGAAALCHTRKRVWQKPWGVRGNHSPAL
jgi:hypothetical protein